MKPFDLTPDPKVLIALTRTPLKPMDALSELVDNAIDAFTLARNSGKTIEHPMVIIDLPSRSEVSKGQGSLRIRDNGLGMEHEFAEKALKAGFSGNNPYDSLGLFGMGLNIATGKMAQRTTLLTARKDDNHALKVVVDLLQIQESGCYEVSPEEIDKPEGFIQGTQIEMSNWWPEGDANYGFIGKLIGYGRPKVRQELGRRYSSILLHSTVRILVNGEVCDPYEHCVWGGSRFVERQKYGKISAVRRFSESVGSQTRCTECFALIPAGSVSCQVCGSSSLRTIDEKISGWVGIQRYDDDSHFGIDLIRNGRAIRLLEKQAFFEYTDDFGNTVKDYPIDSNYGRIVGEVHINHVPVDFMKQDFQRSSLEWQRAMSYLRGDSSLQPTQPNADKNTSPVFLLYQGYRRVRKYGRHDMYMGYWDDQSNAPKRIDRQTEREFLSKFRSHAPGYYDDDEWWRLVEGAETKPIEALVECPGCGAENLQSAELCLVCEMILEGKPCIACEKEIALSNHSCFHCGVSQLPEVEEPWSCQVCGQRNQALAESCEKCDSIRGADNPLSSEYLGKNSERYADLCIDGCSVRLADGSNSMPIDVECFICHRPIVADYQGNRLPGVVHKGEKIQIYIDIAHPIFKLLDVKPEEVVAAEVAYFIHVSNGRLTATAFQSAHSLNSLQWAILNKYWSDSLGDSPDKVRRDIEKLFEYIAELLPTLFGDNCEEVFYDLSDSDQKMLVDNLIAAGLGISKLDSLKANGKFMKYLGPLTLVNLFRKKPEVFFDGAVWSCEYAGVSDMPEFAMGNIQNETRNMYLNCLEDCVNFLSLKRPRSELVKRARGSVQLLQKDLE